MELRHLRYFIAVAEELHFGRAAERLHMSQPPLSQQIRQLEDELGFALFHRTKRTVKLTVAGEQFLVSTRQIFEQLNRAIENGRLHDRGETGQLAIGFVSSAAYNVLPELLQRFRERYPLVELLLREMATRQQLSALAEGRIDVAILRPPIDMPGLEWTLLLEEALVVALSDEHPLAHRPQISIVDLRSETFISFPRQLAPGLFDCAIQLCQQADFSPNIVQETTQLQTIVSLVAAGMGIAIVPSSIQNLQRRGVVYRHLDEATPLAEMAIAWRVGETLPVVRNFLKEVPPVSTSETD